MITVPMRVSVKRPDVRFHISTEYRADLWDRYTGETEIYPSEDTKILDTENKVVLRDITVFGTDLQSKAVEPSLREDLDITADRNYYALERVTVLKVPYEETDNLLGGKTVKIGQ